MGSALERIKVLDLSRYAPGPYCTMILGDLGADIIKIEDKGSELVVPEFPAPGSPFEPLNRNKRSVVLNLKTEEARQVFYKLVEKVDVVVEGFRPGVTQRLGLDYETLKKINTCLVYCSITGYGQDGPYRDLVGHDLNYIAQGGILGVMSRPDVIPGNVLGDLAAGGMQAAIGILAALVARIMTNKGQYVDIAMTDGIVSLLSLYIGKYLETGSMPKHEERATVGGTAYYNVYKTKDNKFITIASGEPRFFANLCKALGCEQFIPYQMDTGKTTEIREFFTRTFLTKTRDEWFDILSRSDTAVGKALAIDELISDPQVLHRQMIVELDHHASGKIKQVGIPIKLSDTPGQIRNFGSRPGEDTAEVLKNLGYSEEEVRGLVDKGAVATA
jgi:crotonobetainyl-CoA:carnitine CoA-transferase CaiB-like acyl-CoA transferase